IRHVGAARLSEQGRADDAGVVGRGLVDPLQGGRRADRVTRTGREGARRPRHHRPWGTRLHDVGTRLGWNPAPTLAVEGPWRKPGPLTFAPVPVWFRFPCWYGSSHRSRDIALVRACTHKIASGSAIAGRCPLCLH